MGGILSQPGSQRKKDDPNAGSPSPLGRDQSSPQRIRPRTEEAYKNHVNQPVFQSPHIPGSSRRTSFGQPQDLRSDSTGQPPTRAAPVSEQRKRDVATNIIIFGETGVGKSSLVNLIADKKLARTSSSAEGCTFRYQQYHTELGGTSCVLWDTTGLDEGSEGTVPAKIAERSLRELMQALAQSSGIHLVIYCIRGTRLTKALRRNYHLFYVTVCRRKVPVALVVTGLEHQDGDMEMWWTINDAVLRRNGMRFDAHACVTTVRAQDHIIQQRRQRSQELLREMIVKYSGLPGWRADPSLLSFVMPLLQSVFRGTPSPDGADDTKSPRKVIVCDSFPGISAGDKIARSIGRRWYEFIRVDKGAVQEVTPRMTVGVGLLVFHADASVNNQIQPPELELLERFYTYAGGRSCPMVVVLQGCDDETVARDYEIKIRHSNMQAHFVSVKDAPAELDELIESMCMDKVERKFLRGETLPRMLLRW